VAVFVPFDDAESGWGFSPDTWCEHCDAWVFVCPHVGGWSEEDAVWHLRRRRAELGHTPAAPCGDSSFAVDVSVDPRWL